MNYFVKTFMKPERESIQDVINIIKEIMFELSINVILDEVTQNKHSCQELQ